MEWIPTPLRSIAHHPPLQIIFISIISYTTHAVLTDEQQIRILFHPKQNTSAYHSYLSSQLPYATPPQGNARFVGEKKNGIHHRMRTRKLRFLAILRLQDLSQALQELHVALLRVRGEGGYEGLL